MELTDDDSQHPSSLDVAEWRSPPFQMTKSQHFVGKQINLWKGRHLFEVFIQFLSSGIRDWLSLHQAGCRRSRQSCFCPYQHSLTKLRAWLWCHGLLVYSCLRTGTEAHPWIPIRWACIFCLLYAGPLPTSKMHCSSSQQLSLFLPSVLLLFLFSKNRCGCSFKFGVYSSSHLPGQDFDRGRVWESQQTTIRCNFSEKRFFCLFCFVLFLRK